MAAPASEVAKETGREAAKKTVNETGKQAASDPSGVLGMITGNPMLAVLAVVSVIAIAIIGAIIFIAYSSRDKEEEFEKEDLETIVKPEFRSVVENQGVKNKSDVVRDLRKEGEIWKDVRFTENDNLKQHLKYLREEDNDFNHYMDFAEPDADRLETWRENGVYSDEEIRKIKDEGVVPHRLLWIRPHKLTDKVIWMVTDVLLGRDWFSNYRLLPEHKMVENPGDGSVSIDRNIQFRPFAGVEIPLYFESFSILHAVVTRRLYEASLEDQVNYSEKINFFDSKFSQRIQELEAEANIEKERYSSDVAGDVNNN